MKLNLRKPITQWRTPSPKQLHDWIYQQKVSRLKAAIAQRYVQMGLDICQQWVNSFASNVMSLSSVQIAEYKFALIEAMAFSEIAANKILKAHYQARLLQLEMYRPVPTIAMY